MFKSINITDPKEYKKVLRQLEAYYNPHIVTHLFLDPITNTMYGRCHTINKSINYWTIINKHTTAETYNIQLLFHAAVPNLLKKVPSNILVEFLLSADRDEREGASKWLKHRAKT